MKLGDTFLLAKGDDHLHVVLSDPSLDPEHVIIVNMTTYDGCREDVCIFRKGDHPWVRHPTCVNYNDHDVKRISVDQFSRAVETNRIIPLKRLEKAMRIRLLEGAAKSKRLNLGRKDILKRQGLI